MSKRIFLLVWVWLSLGMGMAQAQKFGHFDMQFVLNKMPEYKTAQNEINKAAADWEKEVGDLFAEVDRLRKEYQAEEILMTEEMKKEKSTLIVDKERKARERQKKIFGFEGMLFLKRQELVKPVQEKVYEAVEKVCKKKRLQYLFDKGLSLTIIYADTKHDYTDFVLEELGLGDPKDTIDNSRYKDK